MTWQEGVAVAVIVAGLGAGAFLVAQRPSFWIEFGTRLFSRLWPFIAVAVMRRMKPAEEEEWRTAVRTGRGDEWLRQRMRGKSQRER